MFADLNEKLSGVFKRLKGETRISEANIAEAVKQVRMALLEADVNYKVVKSFIAGVQEAALGESVIKSVSPAQQFIKIVHDNLVDILGGADYEASLPLKPIPPTIIMLSGLQGSGKTTSAGKLGRYFARDGKNVLLIAADIYRPAAIDQLEVLGKSLNIDVYSDKACKDAVKIAKDGLEYAKKAAKDIVIIDTAGRLHIDEDLMKEVENVKKTAMPDYTFFVADAMTGQDAVNAATEFNNRLEVTGVILTKTDGDARGGAALSIRYATGKPLMFIGTGEKVDEFELFHPDRMASRILGMGDIVSLVEKAQEVIDIEEAENMASKMKTGLDYNDILTPFSIPGLPKINSSDIDEKRIARTQAIIYSMTKKERAKIDPLTSSRKKRIARGAGVGVNEVNKLIDQLTNMNKMMKKFGKTMGGNPSKDISMKDMAKIMKNMNFR